MPGWISATLGLTSLAAICALLSYATNLLLMPAFQRYAMARANSRSSHVRPTPQGAGVAVMFAALAGICAIACALPQFGLWSWRSGFLALATIGLGVAGAIDDVRPLPVAPRLLVQVLAASLGMTAIFAPAGVSIAGLPAWVTLGLLGLALIWFVNLTNFMDGIDGITLAEFTPFCSAVAVMGAIGLAPLQTGLIAAALLGGLLGFAPFNRHVARLFLGDAGSLTIGFVAGILLLQLIQAGHPVAALILPLYHLADATLTLLGRLLRGERITQAHRTHFYQRATTLGWQVPAITSLVLRVNLVLGVLAICAAMVESPALQGLLLAAAAGLTAWLLRQLSESRPA